MSLNGGLATAGKTKDNSAEWSTGIYYVMDVWAPYYEISKLYPSDYYGPDDLEPEIRHTLRASAGFLPDHQSQS